MGKNKIIIGIIYLLVVFIFLVFFFKYFSIDEITSYDFYKDNRDTLVQFKERSLIFTIIIFICGVLNASFSDKLKPLIYFDSNYFS